VIVFATILLPVITPTCIESPYTEFAARMFAVTEFAARDVVVTAPALIVFAVTAFAAIFPAVTAFAIRLFAPMNAPTAVVIVAFVIVILVDVAFPAVRDVAFSVVVLSVLIVELPENETFPAALSVVTLALVREAVVALM
jgi:hypothetical protein